MSEPEISRKAYLEKQMKVAIRIGQIGLYLTIGSVLFGCMIFAGILEAMVDIGISGFHWSVEVVLLTLPSPVVLVLGLCVWKYSEYKWLKLWEEWNQY